MHGGTGVFVTAPGDMSINYINTSVCVCVCVDLLPVPGLAFSLSLSHSLSDTHTHTIAPFGSAGPAGSLYLLAGSDDPSGRELEMKKGKWKNPITKPFFFWCSSSVLGEAGDKQIFRTLTEAHNHSKHLFSTRRENSTHTHEHTNTHTRGTYRIGNLLFSSLSENFHTEIFCGVVLVNNATLLTSAASETRSTGVFDSCSPTARWGSFPLRSGETEFERAVFVLETQR